MIGNTVVQQDSEAALMASLHKLANAGGSVIQIKTREPQRAALTLRKHLIGDSIPYKEWDVVNGFRDFTRENFTENRNRGDGKDFFAALTFPLDQLRDPNSQVNIETDKIHYFVYVDPHPYIKNNPVVSELIQQYATILPATNVCTLLVTPHVPLDDIPTGTVLVTELSTPTAQELEDVLRRVVTDAAADFPGGHVLEEEDFGRIANMGLGLSLYEFETYAALGVIDGSVGRSHAITADHLMAGIAKGKTAIVKQSEVLELMTTEDIANVGGMGKLKRWVAARANCYSDEAREFGIEPPKGIMLCGVPGTGKSLSAKAIASVLEIPLVRFDVSRVFSKYVGDSESRIAGALKMVEGMAPCVLFLDEIDKGLGGASGGGDSGTASRVLGTFLTWLQDNKAPVFTIVTANRVDGLPPELLRRGRFDQIFSVAMPNADERREVLAIHLRRRNRDIDMFGAAEVGKFVAASENYVPAEIESAVKDALVTAFNAGVELTMDHLIAELGNMVPMSRAHKEQVERIVQWAATHAIPVSDPPKVAEAQSVGSARVIRARRG